MDNRERLEQIEEEMNSLKFRISEQIENEINSLKLLINEQQEMIEKLKRSWFNLRMDITNLSYLE